MDASPRACRRLRGLAAHVVVGGATAAVAEVEQLVDFASHTLSDVRAAWGREAGARLVEHGLASVDDPAENLRLLDEASWAGRARKSTDMDGRHVEERIRYLEEIGAPLAVDGSGQVTAAAMEGLREREAAAAARRDWRLATKIADVIDVVTPRSPLSVDDCAPPTLDGQYDFFLEHGFVSPLAQRRV